MRWPLAPALAVGAVVGVVLLALAHVWLNRRDGVGIVLFLPPAPGVEWSTERLEAMRGHARKRHHAAFTVNIDELSPRLAGGRVRRELVRRVVQARLNEDAPDGVVSAPVTFYIVCSLPDAFYLGHELKFQVHEHVAVHASDEPLLLRGAVGQTSEEPGKTIFTAVRVDSRLRKALSRRQTRRVERLISVEERSETVAPEYAHRAALIVQLTPNVGMVVDASAVAQTGQVGHTGGHRGYVLDERDPWSDGAPCGSLLIVRSFSGFLPDDRSCYEAVVAEIARRWLALMDRCSDQAGRTAEGVLFCSAPAGIAFALGAVVGRGTTVAAYRTDFAGSIRPPAVSGEGNR
jgi:hypothetical protein